MDMFWLMVTVAVGGGVAIPISVIWSKHRQKLAELEAANDAGEVAVLKERIQVLERIATDRGAVTAAQIEALRDEDPTEFAKLERKA